MEKFDIQFEELSEEKEPEAPIEPSSVKAQYTEEDPPFLKTVGFGIAGGAMTFAVICLISIILAKVAAGVMSEFYQSIFDELFSSYEIGISSILEKLDWKHVFLAIHQQFGVFMTPQEASGGADPVIPFYLWADFHLGTGFLLILPVVAFFALFHVSKKWVSASQRGIFILGASLTYSILAGIVGYAGTIEGPSQVGGAEEIIFHFSAIHVFAFSLLISLLASYITMILQSKKSLRGTSDELNPFQEAFKLWLQMLFISIAIVLFFIFLGTQNDSLEDWSVMFAIILAPLFTGFLLFGRLQNVWDFPDDQGLLSWSLSEGLFVENSNDMEEMFAVFSYLEGSFPFMMGVLLFLVVLAAALMRKGFLLTKYARGDRSLTRILIFSGAFSLLVSLAAYFGSFDVHITTIGYDNSAAKAHFQIKVEELPLWIHAFAISVFFSTAGSGIYQLARIRHKKKNPS